MTEPLIHAPDFPYEFQWINAHQPLSLFDDLQGYVVLIHFFTSSNVNSHHVFATLAQLEQRFADRSFMVVGVHTGKFAGERDVDRVTQAVRRFGLRHPVVVDEGGEIWKVYEVSAWPTVVLVDAMGDVRFRGSGEPDPDRMTEAVSFLLDEAAAEGYEPYNQMNLDENDSPDSLEGMRFPAGLSYDDGNGLLWIAEAGRHRVLGVDPQSGEVRHVIGTGEPGAADGGYDLASFFAPQDVCAVEGALLVADTGNHLLRRVDLSERRVDTVLGSNRAVVDLHGGGSGSEQPINSPWGLAVRDGELFVAMAGTHQIWQVELSTMTARAFAGSGRKGHVDGTLTNAVMAQPAGLAVRDAELVFADSDTSALRAVDLDLGVVRSLVAGALYEWGDADGEAPKLQFPTAVATQGADCFVADTLNDKVRCLRDGQMSTLPVDVSRPEGLATGAGKLFVADTGNHRILAVDLAAEGHEVLPIRGVPTAPTAFGTDFVRAAPIRLPPMAEAVLRLSMDLLDGAQLLPHGAVALEAENFEGHALLVDTTVTPDVEHGAFMARGLATGEEGDGVIRLRLTYATCAAPGQICHLHERRLDVPVTIADGADEVANVRI